MRKPVRSLQSQSIGGGQAEKKNLDVGCTSCERQAGGQVSCMELRPNHILSKLAGRQALSSPEKISCIAKVSGSIPDGGTSTSIPFC